MRKESRVAAAAEAHLLQQTKRLPIGGGHTRVPKRASSYTKQTKTLKIALLTTGGVVAALWSFVQGTSKFVFCAIAQSELEDWLIVGELFSAVLADLSDILRSTAGLPIGGR